ncbi:DUF3822 family protein [Salinimicrobium soli]|uniref:DUF3822 family protein n=1 Tax=Salinimicrobium soli TaxID=1254399 RepID=UPI003AADE22C
MGTLNKENEQKRIKLSIQVSLNGLSFCALVPEEKRIIFFKEIHFPKKLNPIQVLEQIENVYEQEKFLQEETPEVIVLFSNELFSLVPQKLFSEEQASDYLKFNTRILETDYVAQDQLETAEMVNVYIPYTNINNFFFEKYGEFEYRHCISVLTEAFLEMSDPEDREVKVYLNCYTGGYDLIIIKAGKLLLANSFQSRTKEDFIYYLLFTAEQLDLDPTTFRLFLLGKITRDSDYYQIAYTYVKEVEFLDPVFGYLFSGKEEVPNGRKNYALLKALQ